MHGKSLENHHAHILQTVDARIHSQSHRVSRYGEESLILRKCSEHGKEGWIISNPETEARLPEVDFILRHLFLIFMCYFPFSALRCSFAPSRNRYFHVSTLLLCWPFLPCFYFIFFLSVLCSMCLVLASLHFTLLLLL